MLVLPWHNWLQDTVQSSKPWVTWEAMEPPLAVSVPCTNLASRCGEKERGANQIRIVDASTPRDGATRKPFQADSTRFKNNNVDACGETLGGGPNEPTEQVTKMVQDSNGMPMISQGGMVMMTLHQVNGDGAGPYKCMIDSTGTGTGGWTDMKVTTNVPGKNSRSKAKAEDFVSSPESGCGQSQSHSDSENKC